MFALANTLRMPGVLFSIVLTSSAYAEYYEYEKWEKLSPALRTSYVAGMFDAYIYFMINPSFPPDISIATAQHSRCITEKKMPAERLSENIRSFTSSRPTLKAGYVQTAFIQYLAHLCGGALSEEHLLDRG